MMKYNKPKRMEEVKIVAQDSDYDMMSRTYAFPKHWTPIAIKKWLKSNDLPFISRCIKTYSDFDCTGQCHSIDVEYLADNKVMITKHYDV